MKPRKSLSHLLISAISSLLAISSVSAQTIVNWEGDVSNLWATAGNWDAAPANSLTTNIANFNLATYGGNPVWAPTVGTATSIAGITIGASNGTMTLTNTAALTIGASGITIANGAGAFTISGSTTLGAAQSWTNNSANLFTFGAVTNGANLLTIGGTGNITASGVIGNGAGGLTKEGAGILTLNAANTYTGATTVNGGELRWGITSAIAGGALNVNNGGTVNLQTFTDTVGTVTIANGGSITGTTGILTTSSLISNDGGTFTGFSAGGGLQIAGGITYNSTGPGSTTLQINRVLIGDTGLNVFDIANGDAAIDFEITETLTASGNNISRTIRKTGAGVMQFSGSQANTTTTNQTPLDIWDGTVIFNKSAEVNALPNGAITIGDGTGSAGSAILQYRTSNNQLGDNSITINSDGLFDLNGMSETTSGALTVNGGSITTGAGMLTLGNATNTFSGATTVTGNLTFSGTAATNLTLGGTASINGTTTFSGGNGAGITATGTTSIAGTLGFGSSTRTIAITNGSDVLTILANITGSGTITKTGAGTLQIGDGTNTGTMSSTSALTMGGGTFRILAPTSGSSSQTIASLATTASTNSIIRLTPGSSGNTTLTITSGTLSTGAGSSLNFDYSAGTTAGGTVGNNYLVWSPTLTAGIIGGAYSVTDSGGTGFATVSGGNVVRLTDPGGAGLPVSTGSATGSYFIGSGYSTNSTTTPGSLVQALSGAVAASNVTVDTTGLTSGANLALGTNVLTLGAGMAFNGANPYEITGSGAGGLRAAASGGTIYLNNGNTSTVTINAPILANGASGLAVNGTGTTILGNVNTYTGVTFLNGGTLGVANQLALQSSTLTMGGGTAALVFDSSVVGNAFTLGGLAASTSGTGYDIALQNNAGSPAAVALTVGGNGASTTYAGVLSGGGSLIKTGAGTLTLSGSNTYSGTTTITSGTLQGRVIGTSLNPVSPFGTNSILLNGGTLELVASGTINSTAETVNFGNNVTVGANATINVNRPGATESNKTMGLGTLTIGANTLTATAANIGYSTGFSAVTMTGNATFSPSSSATLVLGNITQSGGNRSLTKTGVGTLRLTGTNDYAGGTILNGGTLSVNSNAALGEVTTGITVSGNTTLSSAATVSTEYNRAISLGAGTTLTLTHAGGNTASFSGAITGSGNLTATIGTSGSTIALTNTANTFTGDVLLTNPNNGNVYLSFNSIGDAGMMSLGKNGYQQYIRYTGSSDLVLNNRRIDLNSSFSSINDGGGNPINMFENNGIGTIKFNAGMTVAASKTGTFFFGGTNTGDNTYAGVIPNSTGGTLSIGKHGAGKWILSNDNTFTGGVEIRGGTLVLSGTNIYTGATAISGGTLVVTTMANYGDNSSIGKGTLGTSIAMGSNSALVYTGTAVSNTDRQIDFTPSGTSAANSPSILNNGTAALNFTSSIFNTGNATNNNRGLILGGTNGGTISGAMVYTGANTSQGFWSLAKNGSGIWILAGANTNSGETALNAGTLRLDYNASNTSKLSDVATVGFLRLNGGTLELYGGSHAETVVSTTLNGGTTFIRRTNAPNPAPASTSTLQMGVITYTGGALDFSAAGIANVSTSTVTNGILSSAAGTARVTVGGADWAAKDGSNNVIAYTGYSNFDGTASAVNINYSTIGNATLTANRGATSNTFKITTSGTGQSMKLNNNFNLTLGSLLFAGADNYTIAAESGTGRINSAFLLHNYGPGTLTLGATNGLITQFGTGTTILSGNNAADVGINIFGGTVEFSNNLQIGTNGSAQVISLNNGTLRANTGGSIALNSSGNFSRTVSLGAGGGTLDIFGGGTLTVSGVISSATASQLPTLTIGSGSSDGTIVLSGTNTYNGRTFISGGTLSVGTIGNGGVAGNLGQASNLAYNIVFDGGTLAHTGASEVSDRAFTITAGKTATIHTTNNLSLAGATGIATTGALTKTGAGTLTLTGANTYTGATNVSNGTLIVNGSISNSSLTTVASGATIAGSGTIGALTVSSGGFINPGNSPGILNSGNYVQAGTYNAEITGLTPGVTGHDQINVTGTVDITSGSLTALFSAGTYAANDLIFILLNDGSDAITGTYNGFAQGATVTSYGGFDWQISYSANNTGVGTGTFTGGNDIALIAVIPEPSTALLGAFGVLLLLRRRR